MALDDGMRVIEISAPRGAIILANPNAPTSIALSRAAIDALLEEHPDIPVIVDEAYVDFGGESAFPLLARHPNLLIVHTMSKSRALAGLRVGYALGHAALIEALGRVKDSFNSYPLGRVGAGRRDGFGSRRGLFPRELRGVIAEPGRRRGADPARAST